jgi:DNA-binding HxlR family transcriptional regulator
MRGSAFPTQVCSVARSLEIVGEWWTLLVIREAFFGARQFSEFQANLGIARNVLSDRLASLVEAGVLKRAEVAGRGNPRLYTLTTKGRELLPVIVTLMQWGDRWVYGADKAPVRVVERATGAEIAPLRIATSEGRALAPRELAVLPGPGADEAILRRFANMAPL